MYISLDAYRVFYFVAQYRSFTRAAEALYSNQPNVTRTIKNLEQSLGCSLFLRSSRNVQLTPEGEELYAHISLALQQIHAGEEMILRRRTLQSGSIRIGASEIALHRVLLPILERFRKEYPGIRLQIINSNSQQAAAALKAGKVDFAILTLPVALGEDFQQTPIAAFQEVPVCAASLAETVRSAKTLADLAAVPLISLCSGTSTHTLYSNWFQTHGLSFVPDIEAATADQILPLVRSGLGIGFLPKETAEEAAESGEIKILDLPEQPPERIICLVKRKDAPLSIAAEKLEQMLLIDSERAESQEDYHVSE